MRVLDTPGYTRGAVSYLVEVDGVRYGFVGDLIYGDGRLLDLYSLQDAVPQARIGGYHGYAGRIGDHIASLRKVAAQNADILVPARGPVIREPAAAIERLIRRLQAAYENYLSVSAGRWYFRDQYDILAARALGSADKVQWMPYARTIEKSPPDWIVPIHNSRLILARDGSGFLIDCGSRAIIEEINGLKDKGRLTSLDGLFITHYHDDHTDKVNELLRDQNCPVYATPIQADVLARPGDYRLPCLTANAIQPLTVVRRRPSPAMEGVHADVLRFPRPDDLPQTRCSSSETPARRSSSSGIPSRRRVSTTTACRIATCSTRARGTSIASLFSRAKSPQTPC